MDSSRLGLHTETEIIDFLQPLESEKNLYISNIAVNLTKEEASIFVAQELHKEFSRFGLLYGVFPVISHIGNSYREADKSTIKQARSGEICHLYAFVKFYSKLCAKKAKQHLNLTRIVGSAPCKIKFSQRKKSAGRQKELLYPNECVDIANYYLGFDGWSTSVKLMKRDGLTTEEQNGSTCRFVCVVELTIRVHGLTTHGVGKGEEEFGTDISSKASIFARCRKRAHRDATRNAFSRVLLVVVGGGQVHAEIDTTIPDPVTTADCLRDPHILTVNDLLEEPKEETSDEDYDEVDAKMISILAALQEDNS